MQMKSVSGGDRADRHEMLPSSVPATQCELNPGQVVASKQGRDKGRLYLLLRMEADGFVLVSDGRLRPVARPKRKNPKHLLVLHCDVGEVGERLRNGRSVRDNEVAEALARIELEVAEEGRAQ